MGAGRAALRMLQPYRQPQTRLSLSSPVTTIDPYITFFVTQLIVTTIFKQMVLGVKKSYPPTG
jgi:hypothetical protein